MATVLSGTSGALYYKPAGTSVTTLSATDFPATGSDIQVGTYLGFKVNDPVTLAYPAGATTTNAIAAGDYFILTYDATTGVATISSTEGGAAETATAQPSAFGSEFASLTYTNFEAVGDVREWSFEITRDEIDVTTIGQSLGQYAPFKTYITGFADGSGNAMVYTTDDDSTIATRLVEDVIQRNQTGVQFKLYIDRVVVSGTVNDTQSRSVELEAVLTSANFTVNPDDAQMIDVAFRPSAAPSFDLTKS